MLYIYFSLNMQQWNGTKNKKEIIMLISIIEIIFVVGLLWALFHEDIFVDFERKLFAKVKREFKKIKRWVIG